MNRLLLLLVAFCGASECETDLSSALQAMRKQDLARRASFKDGSLTSVARLEESFFFKTPRTWTALEGPFHMIAIKDAAGINCSDASAIRTEQGCQKAANLLDEVTYGSVQFKTIRYSKRPAGCYHLAKARTVVWNAARSLKDVKIEGRFAICKERLVEVELQPQCAEGKQFVTESACHQAGELFSEQLSKKFYWDATKNSQRPAGCYYWADGDAVIWNDVQTGGAFEGRQPLCVKAFEPNENELYQDTPDEPTDTRQYSWPEAVGTEANELWEQVDAIDVKVSEGARCTEETTILTERGCKKALSLLDEVTYGQIEFEEINTIDRPAGCYKWAARTVVFNNAVSQANVEQQDRFSICKRHITGVELQSQCTEDKTIVTEGACLQALRWLSMQMNQPLFWAYESTDTDTQPAPIWNPKRPKGCYYWEEKDRVVWNDVNTGSPYPGRRPICMTTNVD